LRGSGSAEQAKGFMMWNKLTEVKPQFRQAVQVMFVETRYIEIFNGVYGYKNSQHIFLTADKGWFIGDADKLYWKGL
jgi:hypothetical protein